MSMKEREKKAERYSSLFHTCTWQN